MDTAPLPQSFLTREQAEEIRSKFGTPVYVYREDILEENAKAVLKFPNAFGLTARYAMKANPNSEILMRLKALGFSIDASSADEADIALEAGFKANQILLTSQQFPKNFTNQRNPHHQLENLIDQGVRINACDLTQLKTVGELAPGLEIYLRINPGIGSGANNRLTTGGPGASFGIWHEDLERATEIIARKDLKVVGLHTHIGTGADPKEWADAAKIVLPYARQYSNTQAFNFGGGQKVGYMPGQPTADLYDSGVPIKRAFNNFCLDNNGRQLTLEVEPGRYVVAQAGAVLSTVRGISETSQYKFLKVDTGMGEVSRISRYGARHWLEVIPQQVGPRNQEEYVVVGRCCETGDCLTPKQDSPEEVEPRLLTEAKLDDFLLIHTTGAYCSSMSERTNRGRGYNSFPLAREVMIGKDGNIFAIDSK